ncbi:hypothetical protein K469DRAFT_701429 [Zopfia rhizophila CBS 207.26]|uniref:Uncharacterized protein n=1 Tax=Zopfia rhizophila CBS 207.26 TaxID=1314779 RepID=A0A6A6D8G2_9PEZI|nr:hypothetical protein K469DRAFT_701429 [Zopfia rhizophila CBS 207.26]
MQHSTINTGSPISYFQKPGRLSQTASYQLTNRSHSTHSSNICPVSLNLSGLSWPSSASV